MKALASLLLVLLLNVTSSGWSNGGTSKRINSPIFGTHDWIAYEGYRLAQDEADLDWLRDEVNAYFLGTEAPDTSAFLSSFTTEGGYSDATQCHCVLYDEGLDVVRDRAAMRAQQEFDRARAALESGAPDRFRRAAFHVGAMAHYIGDLSQFMHMMGQGSRWGREEKSLHSRYEEVVDKTMVAGKRRSTLLSPYIKKRAVAGNTAERVTLAVAKFVDTGGGTIVTPGWMYGRWKAYRTDKIDNKPTRWEKRFLDQSGDNANVAANGIAKLLVMLSK